MGGQPRLSIEMIPRPCWGINLRSLVSPRDWSKISYLCRRDHGFRCAVCGAAASLHCHEIWEWDEEAEIQRLVWVTALCQPCHAFAHFSLTRVRAGQGRADLEAVIQHGTAVNGWTREEFEQHLRESEEVYDRRSHRFWDFDFGKFSCMLVGPPHCAIPQGSSPDDWGEFLARREERARRA